MLNTHTNGWRSGQFAHCVLTKKETNDFEKNLA
jgi:hypothetical protein